MEIFNKNQKPPGEKKKNKGGKQFFPLSPKNGFFGNVTTAILVLFIIVLFTSFVREFSDKSPNISISELVQDIQAGKVSKIAVEGDDLTVEYKEGEMKKSKKETDASLTETLANYGITPEKLAGVQL